MRGRLSKAAEDVSACHAAEVLCRDPSRATVRLQAPVTAPGGLQGCVPRCPSPPSRASTLQSWTSSCAACWSLCARTTASAGGRPYYHTSTWRLHACFLPAALPWLLGSILFAATLQGTNTQGKKAVERPSGGVPWIQCTRREGEAPQVQPSSVPAAMASTSGMPCKDSCTRASTFCCCLRLSLSDGRPHTSACGLSVP